MINLDAAREIFDKVLKYSAADETEALVGSTSYALTRFANNTIHQNMAEETVSVSVRVVVDQRTARTSTDKLDDDSIRQACESALALARIQPPDSGLLPLLGPQSYREVRRFFPETAELSARARAETVGRVIHRAGRDHLTAAGIFSSGATAGALFNSRGLAAFHQETISEFSVTMMSESGSGWAKMTTPNWREVDVDALAERAARKAVESQEPREIAAGQYTVILEPAAVLDLLGFFVLDFGGLSVAEQRSCFTGRVGQRVFGENINLRDDVYHASQTGAAFDGEGVPRQPVTLVESGVVKNLVYARRTAAEAGRQPTGHGFPLPNEFGEAPMNLVLEGGASTVEEMVRSTSRGLLVTRLWYIREVDPYQKIVTGMTRDGTFWIEGGAVRYGVKNLRFNQSLIEMLRRVEMMGPAVRTSGEETFDMIVPAMKVGNFNFSSVTKF